MTGVQTCALPICKRAYERLRSIFPGGALPSAQQVNARISMDPTPLVDGFSPTLGARVLAYYIAMMAKEWNVSEVSERCRNVVLTPRQAVAWELQRKRGPLLLSVIDDATALRQRVSNEVQPARQMPASRSNAGIKLFDFMFDQTRPRTHR